MIPDGYLPPVRNTEDIPIQRSITAMGMNAPADTFRPYVYRGIGVDQIDLTEWLRAVAIRKETEQWEAERKATALRVQRQRREARESQQREQSEREEQRQVNSIPALIADMHAKISEVLAREAEARAPKVKKQKRLKFPKQPIPSLPRKPARPTPGWKPLVGSDLEDAWAMLDED